MRLLVSVANDDDARAAVEGGADIIDAKDPRTGALGAVSLEVFRQIRASVGDTTPVSAALGDAADEAAIEAMAREFTIAGAAFVKIGFAGICDTARARSLLAAAVRGAPSKVVAVTYADRQGELSLTDLLDVGSAVGAVGILIDTCEKSGPGLRHLIDRATLSAWISAASGAGLTVAAAGKLTIDDLDWVRDCGADIAGVRGAACEGGRTGRVTAERVRLLRAAREAEPATHTVTGGRG
jgi:(5-formylfuran-3-yl)methyl phosphate synthase